MWEVTESGTGTLGTDTDVPSATQAKQSEGRGGRRGPDSQSEGAGKALIKVLNALVDVPDFSPSLLKSAFP